MVVVEEDKKEKIVSHQLGVSSWSSMTLALTVPAEEEYSDPKDSRQKCNIDIEIIILQAY